MKRGGATMAIAAAVVAFLLTRLTFFLRTRPARSTTAATEPDTP